MPGHAIRPRSALPQAKHEAQTEASSDRNVGGEPVRPLTDEAPEPPDLFHRAAIGLFDHRPVDNEETHLFQHDAREEEEGQKDQPDLEGFLGREAHGVTEEGAQARLAAEEGPVDLSDHCRVHEHHRLPTPRIPWKAPVDGPSRSASFQRYHSPAALALATYLLSIPLPGRDAA